MASINWYDDVTYSRFANANGSYSYIVRAGDGRYVTLKFVSDSDSFEIRDLSGETLATIPNISSQSQAIEKFILYNESIYLPVVSDGEEEIRIVKVDSSWNVENLATFEETDGMEDLKICGHLGNNFLYYTYLNKTDKKIYARKFDLSSDSDSSIGSDGEYTYAGLISLGTDGTYLFYTPFRGTLFSSTSSLNTMAIADGTVVNVSDSGENIYFRNEGRYLVIESSKMLYEYDNNSIVNTWEISESGDDGYWIILDDTEYPYKAAFMFWSNNGEIYLKELNNGSTITSRGSIDVGASINIGGSGTGRIYLVNPSRVEQTPNIGFSGFIGVTEIVELNFGNRAESI